MLATHCWETAYKPLAYLRILVPRYFAALWKQSRKMTLFFPCAKTWLFLKYDTSWQLHRHLQIIQISLFLNKNISITLKKVQWSYIYSNKALFEMGNPMMTHRIEPSRSQITAYFFEETWRYIHILPRLQYQSWKNSNSFSESYQHDQWSKTRWMCLFNRQREHTLLYIAISTMKYNI